MAHAVSMSSGVRWHLVGNGSENALEDTRGAGRAARHRHIDGDDVRDASAAGVALPKNTTGAAAVTDGDHELGIRGCLISSQQRHFHMFGNRTRDQQEIGVPGTCDEPDSESLEVVKRIIEGVDLEFAAVAGTCINVADAQCTPQHCTNVLLYAVADAQALIGLRWWLGGDTDRRNLTKCF